MKVNCIFDGGLGNQLFQYAFAFALKHQLRGSTIEAVTSLVTKRYPRRDYFLKQLGLEIPECRMDIQKHAGVLLYRAVGKRIPVLGNFSGMVVDSGDWRKDIECAGVIRGDIWLYGYWQDKQVADMARDHLRRQISNYTPTTPESLELAARLSRQTTIAVHVRRGDYVSEPKTHKIHNVCSPQYYLAGVERLRRKWPKLPLLVFSDDIDWCKKELGLRGNVDFVDPAIPDVDQFVILSRCRHLVISNSTFSWWAAYLGVHDDNTIVAPRYWFRGVETSRTGLFLPRWQYI